MFVEVSLKNATPMELFFRIFASWVCEELVVQNLWDEFEVSHWCLRVFQATSIGSNTAAEWEIKLGRVPSLRDFSTKALVGSLPRTKLFIVRSQPVKSALLSSLVLQASLATGFWHLEVSEFVFEGAISVVLAWRTALLLRASRRIRMSNTEPTLVEPGYDITLAAILFSDLWGAHNWY